MRPAKRFHLGIRLAFAVAVVALGAGLLTATAGGVGTLVSAVGNSFSGLLDDLTATPSPTATPIIVADAPLITPPSKAITSDPTVDLVITVPSSAVREEGAHVRIYLALPDQTPAPIADVLVGATPRLVVPIALTEGRNDFTATVIGSGGESESSPVVTYFLDVTPPAIVLSSPKDGATIATATVDLKGKTEPNSGIVARNEANNASTTGRSNAEGNFSVTLPVEVGVNGITLTVTDAAGNVSALVVSLRRGSGVLTASLTASSYRLSIAALPTELQLVALVTDPAGRPLDGATVTFTLTIPGLAPILGEATTRGDGTAVFRTIVPKSAQAGGGLATALVITPELGTATARTVITIAN